MDGCFTALADDNRGDDRIRFIAGGFTISTIESERVSRVVRGVVDDMAALNRDREGRRRVVHSRKMDRTLAGRRSAERGSDDVDTVRRVRSGGRVVRVSDVLDAMGRGGLSDRRVVDGDEFDPVDRDGLDHQWVVSGVNMGWKGVALRVILFIVRRVEHSEDERRDLVVGCSVLGVVRHIG